MDLNHIQQSFIKWCPFKKFQAYITTLFNWKPITTGGIEHEKQSISSESAPTENKPVLKCEIKSSRLQLLTQDQISQSRGSNSK